MHEWCVQRDKGLNKNRFKSEIFITIIKIFCYSVKFDERKKKGENKWVLQKCYRFWIGKILAHWDGW